MKFLKVFSILALSVVALSINAAATRKCTITLTGATEGQNVVKIYEDAAYATPSLTPYNPVSDAGSINFWIVENSSKWAIKTAAAIDGTILAFKGNADNSYTMTFSNVKSEVKIYDAVEKEVITVTEGGTYAFTAAANTEVTDRFVIGEPAPEADYTRDVTSGNWGTICLPSASSSFTGMDLYTVAGYNAQEGKLGVDPVVGQMEAGMPYIFKATAAKIEVFYTTDDPVTDPVEGDNYLVGTFEDTTTPEKAYVVANNMLNWVAFATVPANRAFLNVEDITTLVPASAAPGRKFLPAPKGVVTGLDGAAINGMKNGKYIMNGRFMIVKDGKTTNVLGL